MVLRVRVLIKIVIVPTETSTVVHSLSLLGRVLIQESSSLACNSCGTWSHVSIAFSCGGWWWSQWHVLLLLEVVLLALSVV